MADPFTLFSIAAAATSAVSSVAGGVAGRNQARAEERAAIRNAEETGRAIASESSDAELQRRRVIGETLVATGASGLTLSGSALTVADENLYALRAEEMQRRRELVMQRENFQYEARAARTRGQQAMAGGVLGALGSVAQGASSAFGGSPGSPAAPRMTTTASGRPLPKWLTKR